MSTKIDDAANKAVLVTSDKIPLADGTGVPRHYTVAQIAKAHIEDAITDGVTDKAPTENAVFDALALKIPTSYLDTDVNLAANSDSKIATQKAVKAYADAINVSAETLTGTTIASNVTGSSLTSLGTLTSLSTSGQITSTLVTGTAPLSVSSTTQVSNLYATRAATADFISLIDCGGAT